MVGEANKFLHALDAVSFTPRLVCLFGRESDATFLDEAMSKDIAQLVFGGDDGDAASGRAAAGKMVSARRNLAEFIMTS